MLLCLSGCGLFEKDDGQAFITVGPKRITLGEFQRDLDSLGIDIDLSKQGLSQTREQIVAHIVDRYLILEYAKREGVSLSEAEFDNALNAILIEYPEDSFEKELLRRSIDFESWKQRLRQQLLIDKAVETAARSLAPPSEEEIRAFFDAHQEDFRTPRMVRFRQILTRTLEAGEDILGHLQNGADFEDLARAHSIAPEASRGGELGWIAEGILDDSMDDALFALTPGRISPVIETPYGFHIFEVLAFRPQGIRPLPEVIEKIESELMREKRETFSRNWVKELRNHFHVEVNYDLMSKMEAS
jgi:parvulin-like peptidyl-prolyl isomerase